MKNKYRKLAVIMLTAVCFAGILYIPNRMQRSLKLI